MKVCIFFICNETVIAIDTTPISCTCGNITGAYWEDGCHYTVAVEQPLKAALYGCHSLLIKHRVTKILFKQDAPLWYILFYPITLLCEWFVKIRVWSTTGKGVWLKPWSQALCKTTIGQVVFYTYD